MNSLVGKSTGIALLLAAGLLAALFAMGVFSASGVGAHSGTENCPTDNHHTDDADPPVQCQTTGHTAIHTGIIRNASATVSNSLPAQLGVTLEVSFQVALSSADGGGDVVVVSDNFAKAATSTATVTQGGVQLQQVTGTAGNTITISTYTTTHPIKIAYSSVTTPAIDDDSLTITQDDETAQQASIDAGISVAGGDVSLSSNTAGDAVQVVIKANADAEKTSATDITVDLAKFGVPSTIPERSVIIADDDGNSSGTDDGYIGEPGSVTVNGTKITLALYSRFPGQSAGDAGGLTGPYTITFKQSAGITNPIAAGTASITVKDGDTTDHSLTEAIKSKVKLSKTAGPRGTAVTVSAVGLGGGGATVYLVDGACPDQGKNAAGDDCNEENDISLGASSAAGGKISVDIETTSSDFNRGAVQIDKNGKSIWRSEEQADGSFMQVAALGRTTYEPTDALRGVNQITIVDGTGRTADKVAWFMITPTISVDEDSVQQGDELTVLVEDWYYGPFLSTALTVTIGAEGASPGVGAIIEDTDFDSDSGDGEIDILVPTTSRLGEQQLKVTGTTRDLEGGLAAGKADNAKGTVIIGALDIEVDPPVFVLGQQFTIKVSGFSTEDPPANVPAPEGQTDDVDESDPIQLVKVGDITLEETTGGVSISSLEIDTNGDFTNTFVVKSTFEDADNNEAAKELTPGTYRVEVRDHSGRIAIGKITIPEPSITIDPPVSRRGTTVQLVGENFPAGRVVQVYYKEAIDELLQGAVLADSAGKLRLTFSVPSDAEIGEEQDVIAQSAANESKFKAKTEHALPDQEIIVTPSQVSAGGRLRIEGHNMPLFTLVGLHIADIRVAGQGAETDGLGSFVKEQVLVPQLKPGTHQVEATVQTQGGEAKVRTTIEIVDIITRDSEEAFADLITNGTLTRVWHLDAATQTWSFFDPAPEFADFNTLTEVSSEQIVTIIMGSQDEFQGRTLYEGSNNVAIE